MANIFPNLRLFNTDVSGRGFSAAVKDRVWAKGKIVSNNDPAKYRKDVCGAWIAYDDYGKTTTYGWEIDHIKAVANSGTDDLTNLQPLQWENNRSKSDNTTWECAIVADDTNNVAKAK